MTNISDNFTRSESTCRCGCGKFGADIELVKVLEMLRAWLRINHNPNAIVKMHSWFRCYEHNNRPADEKNSRGIFGAGSNKHSWHLTGAAGDFSSPNVPNELIVWFLRDAFPDKYGVGIYDWGVHLDMRPMRVDWDYRSDALRKVA